ncbi:MAG: DUF748 domain-containing protein [Thermodesulfobacteriota bacterium]
MMIHNLSRRRKWLLAITGLLAIYVFTGFFIIPLVARNTTVSKLSQAIDRKVAIGKVRFNPFTLTLAVENFSVKQKDSVDDMAAFQSLFVNLEWRSLFRAAPVVSQARLDKPVVRLFRDERGAFNFSDLIQPAKEEPSSVPEPQKADSEASLFAFSLANIEIVEGDVVFKDESKGKIHRLEHLNVGVPFISTIGKAAEVFVLPRFSADIDGRPFSLEGKTKPFHHSLETNFNLELKELDLPYYLDYVPAALPVTIKNGTLDANLTISFINTPETALRLSGRTELKGLKATDAEDRPLLELDRLGIGLSPSGILGGDIHLSAVELEGPKIHLVRDASGRLNILPPPADAGTGAPAEEDQVQDRPESDSPMKIRVDAFRLADAVVSLSDGDGSETADGPSPGEIIGLPLLEVDAVAVDTGKRDITIGAVRTADGRLRVNRLKDGTLNLQALSGPAAEPITEEPVGEDSTPEEASPSWVVSLSTLSLDNYQVRAEGLLPGNSAGAVVDQIRAAVTDFSTRRDNTGQVDFSCRLNESGLLTVKGGVGLSPLSAGLAVGLDHLGLPGLYPFLADYVPGEITGGEAFLQGDVSLAPVQGKDLAATFQGQAAIRDFKSIDRQKGGPLVAFDGLELNAVRAGNHPAALEVGDIRLIRPSAEVAIDAGGKLNLARTAGKDEAGTGTTEFKADPSPESAGKSVSVDIGKIVLADGRLRFSDLSSGRLFQAGLSKANLEVSGVSSRPDQVAEVLFSGLLDNQTPLNLSGRISPLSRDLYADLLLKVENLELSGVSPYSGRYIGRDIAKGKLFTDLGYIVKDRKMTGENHIFIDQLELGKTVDSPDAADLPVGLAISLLRDRQGKIVLDVPVSGDLNDPKFSLGRIILQAFTNIVVKAATSPFSLVGAVMGGADPSHLEFAYGSADIPEATGPVVDKLVDLLYDRPKLAIELNGFVDGEKDRQALADMAFLKKLKAVKHAAMPPAEARATAVDNVLIAPEEFEEYLWQAYKLEPFDKQKNVLGLDSRIPSAEIETLMRQHIQVDDDQLKTLADQRARRIRDRILASGKVEPARVFVVEASFLKPEAIKGVGNSRVDVRLK